MNVTCSSRHPAQTTNYGVLRLPPGGISMCRCSSFIFCLAQCIIKRFAKNGLHSIPIPACISHQGDGTLFAERNFKKDVHSDFRSCILIGLLQLLYSQVNPHRSESDWIRQGTETSQLKCGCGSTLCMSICHRKEMIVIILISAASKKALVVSAYMAIPVP